jgi:outer membrane protein TolC
MNLKKMCNFRLAEIAKPKKQKVFWASLLMLLCANLSAQEAAAAMRLSPEEAVDLAIRNNLSLESSRVSLETRRRASNLSWNQFIPNITVAGILSRDNELGEPRIIMYPAIPEGTAGTPATIEGISGNIMPVSHFFIGDPIAASQWHIAGSIQTSLNISIAMFENMKRLRLDYESGLLGYEKAKAQLERDVRKAYHNMLLLQENIALLRGSFVNAERQVQMARANYNAGLAPELTLLQARVAMENMRPMIDQAESGLKLSMAQFAMYLGLDYNTEFELIPVTERIDFIPFDVADMISRAASGRPDIQELRHTILMLQSARQAQIYSLTPSLSLSWNLNPVFTGDPWKNSWFDNNYWMKQGSFSITLGMRLHSLIPFSPDFQGIRNIDDQIRTANIGLAQMIYGTEIEIYNTVLALERTRLSAEAQAQTVALAEQSYRLTEEAYRAGLQDYFQVQNAEQSLRQARVQLLEQQFNYLNGLIDLEYSIGVPFGTLSRRSR